MLVCIVPGGPKRKIILLPLRRTSIIWLLFWYRPPGPPDISHTVNTHPPSNYRHYSPRLRLSSPAISSSYLPCPVAASFPPLYIVLGHVSNGPWVLHSSSSWFIYALAQLTVAWYRCCPQPIFFPLGPLFLPSFGGLLFIFVPFLILQCYFWDPSLPSPRTSLEPSLYFYPFPVCLKKTTRRNFRQSHLQPSRWVRRQIHTRPIRRGKAKAATSPTRLPPMV